MEISYCNICGVEICWDGSPAPHCLPECGANIETLIARQIARISELESALSSSQEQLRLTHIDWVNTESALDAAQARIDEQDGYIDAIDSAFSDMNDACVSLENQLAAATARIEDLLASRAMDDAQFTKDRARIEKLERMVVWAVENYVALHGKGMMVWSTDGATKRKFDHCGCDGTAPSILAAVERAMSKP